MASALARDLGRLVGRGNVLASPAALLVYGRDASLARGKADVVVLPESTEQVSAVLGYCHRRLIHVTPRGHGTDLSGGAVPFGGVVVALTRMRRILSLDSENRVAVVEAGVVNADLQRAAGAVGLMYAPDPASQAVCSLGGNAAKCSGGIRGLKYGVTRDHVLGLTVVLPDGEVCWAGQVTEQVLPDLDWVGLLVGSEGTLGVITELILKLVPAPPASRTLLAVFERVTDASQAVASMVAEGITPSALELMDKTVMEAVEAAVHAGLPTTAEAALLIEIDGLEAGLASVAGTVESICRREGATQVRVAQTPDERRALWLGRRKALGAVARLRPSYDLEDVTVPRNRLTEMLGQIAQVSRDHGLSIGILAHAGDGNLHPVILFDERDEDEVGRVHAARRQLFRRALDLGGTLSGEHGIGVLKTEFLPWLFSPDELRVMRSIKTAFDPGGILNAHKLLGLVGEAQHNAGPRQ